MLKGLAAALLFFGFSTAALGAVGGLNPKDNGHATSTRPAEVNTGANVRRWWTDVGKTGLYAEDMNRILAQMRSCWDYYGVTDVEGDDTLLRQCVTAAVSAGVTTAEAYAQPLNSNLTSFAGLLTTGMVSHTGTGTYAARQIMGPAAGLTITNGDGILGNPTLALANDLAAIEALTGTGIPHRTGTDTWSLGAIVLNTSDVTGTLGILNGGTGAISAGGARANLGLVIGTNVEQWDPDLDAIAALTGTGIPHDAGGVWTNSAISLTADVSGILPGGNGGTGNAFVTFTGPTTALKTYMLPNANATILTDAAFVSVLQGGTGGGTAADARNNLGLAIGVNVEAWDPDLDGLAALSGTGIPHDAGGTWSLSTVSLTSDVGGLLPIANGGTGASTATAARSALGLLIGTNVEAWSANLDAVSALSGTGIPHDAAGTWSLSQIDLTADVANALPIANGGTGSTSASAARTALGLAIGSNVEQWGANLDGLVALSGTGIPHDAAGTWSLGAINLGSADVTSLLGVGNGGTGTNSLASNGLLLGHGPSAVTALGVGATGQVLIGNTSAAPTWSATPSITSLTASGNVQAGLLVATDTSGSYGLQLKDNEALTALRTLNIVSGNVNRTLTFTGNATLNQDVSTTGTPLFANVQASQVRVTDGSGSYWMGIRNTETLTATRQLTIKLNDAVRNLTFTGDATLNQDVSTAGAPSFAGMTLTAAAAITSMSATGTVQIGASGVGITLPTNGAILAHIPSGTQSDSVCYNATTAAITYAGSTCGTAPSDRRVKDNIDPLDPDAVLEQVDALTPVSFTYRLPEYPTGRQFGLIAQDVQERFPSFVSRVKPTRLTPDGTLMVDYPKFIPIALAAIKALDRKIDRKYPYGIQSDTDDDHGLLWLAIFVLVIWNAGLTVLIVRLSRRCKGS